MTDSPGYQEPPQLADYERVIPDWMERAGTIGRTADHRWFWCSSEDFDFWDGPPIDPDTISPVYRPLPPNGRSGADRG